MSARANPSTDAYEHARELLSTWLMNHPHDAIGISADAGGQLVDTIAWEIQRAEDQASEVRQALEDCIESLSRLADADGAYRVSCIIQAKKALRGPGPAILSMEGRQ